MRQLGKVVSECIKKIDRRFSKEWKKSWYAFSNDVDCIF